MPAAAAEGQSRPLVVDISSWHPPPPPTQTLLVYSGQYRCPVQPLVVAEHEHVSRLYHDSSAGDLGYRDSGFIELMSGVEHPVSGVGHQARVL